MKSVLISVRPNWCEPICNLIKTVEVRKDKPKLDTPFKCLIYCTVGGNALCPPHANSKKWSLHRQGNGTINGRTMTSKERLKSDYQYANGKVIGEFVVNVVTKFNKCDWSGNQYDICDDYQIESCLSHEELWEYGKGKTLYGWHISDLKIYDKPRELSAFYSLPTKCRSDCKEENPMQFCGNCKRIKANRKLTKAPQSWCYVEEVIE